MPKVPLQISGNAGFIIAPDFCPYQDTEYKSVHASICPLCRICTFIGPNVSLPGGEPTEAQRQAFAEYLTSKNVSVSKSISGQNQYLSKEDRIPLMLLISYAVVMGMLEHTIEDIPRRQEVLSYALSEQQLCHVLGVPVHFSNKLSKTPVQLVGEITWK